MNYVINEIEGILGSKVLKEQEELINLYDLYEGKGQLLDKFETDYVPTRKISNNIKKLIKKEARFLFGRTPSITVKANSDKANDYLNAFMQHVFNKSLFEDRLIKGARDCFIGKRIAIKLHADTITQEIEVSFVRSLEFVFEPYEDNDKKLKKIIFFHKVHDATDRAEDVYWRQKYEMVEHSDGNEYPILNEGYYDGMGKLIEVIHEDVTLPLSGIPCYVLFNDGLGDDLEGESDVQELIDNAIQYNELASEDIDTLKKGMNAITIGVDVEPKHSDTFRRKPGAYWDAKTRETDADKQANIYLLEQNFGYDTRLENSLKRLLSDMHGGLDIPIINLETMQGTIVSGKGMRAIYWDLIGRCDEKMKAWTPAFKWLAMAILELACVYQIADVNKYITVDDIVTNDVIRNVNINVQNFYPIQEDEDEEKSLDMQQVNNKVMSKKSYMKKWQGLTDEEADKELEQIKLESQMEDSYNQFVDTSTEDEDKELPVDDGEEKDE